MSMGFIDTEQTAPESVHQLLKKLQTQFNVTCAERDEARHVLASVRDDRRRAEACLAESDEARAAYVAQLNVVRRERDEDRRCLEDARRALALGDDLLKVARGERDEVRQQFAASQQLVSIACAERDEASRLLADARRERDQPNIDLGFARHEAQKLEIELDAVRADLDSAEALIIELSKAAERNALTETLHSMLTLLARCALFETAKNYVEMVFEWNPGMVSALPCHRAALVLYRDDAQTQGDLIAVQTDRLAAAGERLSVIIERLAAAENVIAEICALIPWEDGDDAQLHRRTELRRAVRERGAAQALTDYIAEHKAKP